MREESSAGTGDISKDGGSAMAYGSGAAGAGPRRAAIRAPCGEAAPSACRLRPPVHRPSSAKAPGQAQGRVTADVGLGRRPARPTDQSNL